jgi:hypothetical protein
MVCCWIITLITWISDTLAVVVVDDVVVVVVVVAVVVVVVATVVDGVVVLGVDVDGGELMVWRYTSSKNCGHCTADLHPKVKNFFIIFIFLYVWTLFLY